MKKLLVFILMVSISITSYANVFETDMRKADDRELVIRAVDGTSQLDGEDMLWYAEGDRVTASGVIGVHVYSINGEFLGDVEVAARVGDVAPSRIFQLGTQHYGQQCKKIKYNSSTYGTTDTFVTQAMFSNYISVTVLNELWLKNGVDFTITNNGASKTIRFTETGLVSAFDKLDFYDENGNNTFSADIGTLNNLPGTGCSYSTQVRNAFYAGKYGVTNCGVFEHYYSSAGGEIYFKNTAGNYNNLLGNTLKLADTTIITAKCEGINNGNHSCSCYTGLSSKSERGTSVGWYIGTASSFSLSIGTIHLYN